MKKQSNAKAKAKPETAARQTAAKVKADKAEKRTGSKAAAVADKRELLREAVEALLNSPDKGLKLAGRKLKQVLHEK